MLNKKQIFSVGAFVALFLYWLKLCDSWFIKDLLKYDIGWLYAFVGIIATVLAVCFLLPNILNNQK